MRSKARNQTLKSGKKEDLKSKDWCAEKYPYTVWRTRGVRPAFNKSEFLMQNWLELKSATVSVVFHVPCGRLS